jgi:hypothetical protein
MPSDNPGVHVCPGNEAWQQELVELSDLARCEVTLLPLTALARVRYLNATGQQVRENQRTMATPSL